MILGSDSVKTTRANRPEGCDYDHLIKIMITGDSGTGKYSLLLRFVNDTFSESFISTIGEDFKVKTIQCDGWIVKLEIYDTA